MIIQTNGHGRALSVEGQTNSEHRSQQRHQERYTLMRTYNDLALHARCFCLTQGKRSGTAEKYYAGTEINNIP